MHVIIWIKIEKAPVTTHSSTGESKLVPPPEDVNFQVGTDSKSTTNITKAAA